MDTALRNRLIKLYLRLIMVNRVYRLNFLAYLCTTYYYGNQEKIQIHTRVDDPQHVTLMWLCTLLASEPVYASQECTKGFHEH